MPFHWIPASNNPTRSGMAIYIRYHEIKTRKIKVLDWSPSHILFNTPDRDILLVTNSNWQQPIRPINENWDELFVFAPYYSSYRDHGFKYLMNNYTSYTTSKNHITGHRKKGARFNDQKWIGDSGGFQFHKCKIKYLDPLKILDWYNDNVDIGMALDIPISGLYKDLFHDAVQVQRKNTDLMLKHKSDNVEIMTVLQGGTWQRYLESASVLINDKISKIAIAGLSQSPAEGLLCIMSVFQELKNNHDHFHYLGYSGLVPILLINRWRNFHAPDHIFTVDSSGLLKISHSWNYKTRDRLSQKLLRTRAGIKCHISGKHQIYPQTLPCQCPICYAIKYVEIFTLPEKSAIVQMFLSKHNEFRFQEVVQTIDDYSKFLDDKQFAEYGKSIINDFYIQDFQSGLNVLKDFQSHGTKKTEKRNAYYITSKNVLNNGLLANRVVENETIKKRKFRRKYLERTIHGYLNNKFSPQDHAREYGT